MSDIIKTEALTYVYQSGDGERKVALDGVDLSISRGEFVAVLGHNGSGKSTLACHFNGIRLPTGGAVYIDSMDTRNPDLLYDIRKTCAMVFQNPDNQIVATVVEEDVAFALENLGLPPDEIRRRVDDALRAVGMYEFRRAVWSLTSRPPCSTRPDARRSCASSATSIPGLASPSCSSPTTWMRPCRPAGSWSCMRARSSCRAPRVRSLPRWTRCARPA